MNKRYLLVAAVGILLLVIVPVAMAFDGPPSADAWVDTSGTTNFGTAPKLQNQSSNVSACAPDWRSYLQWDISAIATDPAQNKQIGSATIDLTVRLTDVTTAGVTISVYRAANSTWTETGITGANQPGIDPNNLNALSSFTFPAAPVVGTTYTIPSSTALTQYLNTVSPVNGGNGIVSLVLQISGCPLGTSRIDFDSRQGIVAPQLHLKNPNAVDLSVASAQRTTSWPLYAGLGALAIFVIAGVVISRRRTA